MPAPILIALVVLAVVTAGIVVTRRRRAALPDPSRGALDAPSTKSLEDDDRSDTPATPAQSPTEAAAAPTQAEPSAEPAESSAEPVESADSAESVERDPGQARAESLAPEPIEETTSAPLFAPPKARPSPGQAPLELPKLNLPTPSAATPSRPPTAAPNTDTSASSSAPPTPTSVPAPAPAPLAAPVPVELPQAKPKPARDPEDEQRRIRKGLSRTRKGFVARLAELVRGRPKVSDDLKDDIEEVLFTADIGAKTAQKLLDGVTGALDRDEVADPDAVWGVIQTAALDILRAPEQVRPPTSIPVDDPPYVLLMIGVNGVGKTTTLGKLASRHMAEGRRVLLVAGDTFRAAAREQLDVWARRVGCDIHFGKEGADPSSVIFDGIAHARAEGHDVVLCDTAGRLHTKKELMDELAKIRRSAGKAMSQGQSTERWPHDTFLVLDATIGQNALSQATLFKETMEFTGLVLTKLDGTAKGGVVLGVCDELQVPIRYIGIGEGIEDLRVFAPETFADALFAHGDD